ncbi:MAG TPA: hypothetical protein VIL55_06005 [Naasia sp.]
MISLGTRWPLGGEPPARVPAEFASAVADAEAGIRAAGVSAGSWTLTWLEGRPIAEFDGETPDGYATVSVNPATGEPHLTYEQ